MKKLLLWLTGKAVCDSCGIRRLKTLMLHHQGRYFCDDIELEKLRLRSR